MTEGIIQERGEVRVKTRRKSFFTKDGRVRGPKLKRGKENPITLLSNKRRVTGGVIERVGPEKFRGSRKFKINVSKLSFLVFTRNNSPVVSVPNNFDLLQGRDQLFRHFSPTK